MRRSLLFFLLLILLFSCSKDENKVIANSEIELQNACKAEDPLAIDWMQDLKEELHCGEYFCEVSIVKSEYEGETVFFILVTDPLCNASGVRNLYNCYGEIIKEFTAEESSIFLNDSGVEADFEILFSCNG